MSGGFLRFTLLGTGSSGGVPRIGNDWGACDPSEPKNRRRRCSALVEYSEKGSSEDVTRILIDTSPDIREQLLSVRVSRLDGVLITHDHADQTHGLDDLRALAIRARSRVPVHMDAFTETTLTRKFDYCFEGKGDYPPILDLQPLLRDLVACSITGPGGTVNALPLRQQHGRIPSLGFRFSSVAYCNDVSELSQETIEALQGIDVFVVDALRYTPHPTHAHLERSLGWIDMIRPKRAILTNLHIDMDYATLVKNLPEGVEPGYDGMSIELPL